MQREDNINCAQQCQQVLLAKKKVIKPLEMDSSYHTFKIFGTCNALFYLRQNKKQNRKSELNQKEQKKFAIATGSIKNKYLAKGTFVSMD